MSNMIQCDSCKKMMYADPRSDNDDYFYISVNTFSHSCYLCKKCFISRLGDVFKELIPKFNKENENNE